MTPQEAVLHLNKKVQVQNPKVNGTMLFTAYIFRIVDNKKRYQAEVQNINPPHEIYIVSLDDLKGESNETVETEPDKGWISVKDRLPEPETWVMVYIEYPSPVFEVERGIRKMSDIKKLFYDGVDFYCDFGEITHWMPMPEPPKGENNE